jgi:membrane protein DedA with SNARE-associated domain
LPVVRTYISLPAGISRMNFGQFLLFTLLGSLPWTFVLAAIGFAFGDAFQKQLAQLTTVFHGLDIVIGVLIVAGVAYYIYRHLKHDRNARTTPPEQPELTARR